VVRLPAVVLAVLLLVPAGAGAAIPTHGEFARRVSIGGPRRRAFSHIPSSGYGSGCSPSVLPRTTSKGPDGS